MSPASLPFEYPFQWDNESLREGAGVTPEGAAILKQRDRDLEDYLATLSEVGAGGGAGPTFVIAAADANGASKAIAHYQCDGTDDDLTINEAIAAFGSWAGRLLFTEGQFNITGPITLLPFGTVVQGMGYSTYFAVSYYAHGFATSGSVTFRDFTMYGSLYPQTGIASQGQSDTIENVEISGFENDLRIDFDRCVVSGCRLLDASVDSLWIRDSGDDANVQGCYIEDALTISGTDADLILGNRFGATATITINAPTTNACLANNYLPGGLANFTDSGTGTQRGTNFSSGGTW